MHECPEEQYEDKGRKSGKSRRMVKYKQRYSMNSFFLRSSNSITPLFTLCNINIVVEHTAAPRVGKSEGFSS